MDKILTFVVNKETKKLLLLLGSPHDPQYKVSFWYVVTGGKEEQDSSLEDTVEREVKEETNLNVEESIYLNWIFKYESLGRSCTEYVYISFVDNTQIILNEESIEYMWCDIDEFIAKINWYGNKELLRQVITYGINKEKYIAEEIIEIT